MLYIVEVGVYISCSCIIGKQETVAVVHLDVYSNECSKHSGVKITPLSGLYSSAFVVYTYSDD